MSDVEIYKWDLTVRFCADGRMEIDRAMWQPDRVFYRPENLTCEEAEKPSVLSSEVGREMWFNQFSFVDRYRTHGTQRDAMWLAEFKPKAPSFDSNLAGGWIEG